MSCMLLSVIILTLPFPSDEFTLTLNNRASVVSMAYAPLVSPLAPSCDELEPTTTKEFVSKISLETATPAMAVPSVLPNTKPPPGLKFLKSKNNKNGNPEGEEEATTPQSFLKKYWYIILPVFIMSMISGGGQEEPQQAPHPSQQQGGGQVAATAPATSSQAAVPSGGGAQPRRRGKRG